MVGANSKPRTQAAVSFHSCALAKTELVFSMATSHTECQAPRATASQSGVGVSRAETEKAQPNGACRTLS